MNVYYTREGPKVQVSDLTQPNRTILNKREKTIKNHEKYGNCYNL